MDPRVYVQYAAAWTTPELVNRHDALNQIQKALRGEGSQVFYITADGGIGKTMLVREVLRRCQTSGQWARPDLLAMTELVDFYHTTHHTFDGFAQSVREALSEADPIFAPYDAARKEFYRKKYDLAEMPKDLSTSWDNVAATFLDSLNRLAQGRRLVLAFDTTERLLYEVDPVQKDLELEREGVAILQWLLKVFLPGVRNAVILLAGRPVPAQLRKDLKGALDEQLVELNLTSFTIEDTRDYFSTVVKAIQETAAEVHQEGDKDATEQIEAAARRVQGISAETQEVIWHYTGGRPIMLALMLDYLITSDQLHPSVVESAETARRQTPEELEHIRTEIEADLVRFWRETAREADPVIEALARVRKGLDAELLARIDGQGREGEWDTRWAQQLLEKAKVLSFVKVRPADNRVFLHDEIYALLQKYQLDSMTEAERDHIFQTLRDYYAKRIKSIRAEIAELYRPAAETTLPEATEVIIARSHLQNAYVENLHYQLRWNARQGFQTYFRYAEEAIAANDESLDMQLRAELLGFLAEHSPSDKGQEQEVDGLSWTDIAADSAVRWVKRLISYGKLVEALEMTRLLRADVQGVIEAGGNLAKAELDTWEALILTDIGESYDEAENLLNSALQELEHIPRHSVRSAGILARTYNNLGYVHRLQGRYHRAIVAYDKALPLWRATRIEIEQANTLNNRAFALAEVGNYNTAWPQAWDGLDLRERLGPRYPVGLSLNTLAHIRIREGAVEEARYFAERALDLFKTLGSSRGQGLALVVLAEAERRASDWEPYFPNRTDEWLEKAVEHAGEACHIFREKVKEPARLVEALIELGCDYRDWAKFKQDYPDIRTPGEGTGHTKDQLAQQSRRSLQEAVMLAEEHSFLYRQIQALVNLAWLHYYTDLYVGAEGFDQARESLENGLLAQIEDIVPRTYRIAEHHTASLGETRGGLPILDRGKAIIPIAFQLGKLELLRGQIAFNHFKGSLQQDVAVLKEAVIHYTISLAYNALFDTPVSRDMRRGMDRIYDRLRELNPEELRIVLDTVEEVERKYKMGESRMRRFLGERSLVPVEIDL